MELLAFHQKDPILRLDLLISPYDNENYSFRIFLAHHLFLKSGAISVVRIQTRTPVSEN